jgi:hypothetical protein
MVDNAASGHKYIARGFIQDEIEISLPVARFLILETKVSTWELMQIR